jgi:hypothetical protein
MAMLNQNYREWQRRALAAIRNDWVNPDHKTLIAACPSAGKTFMSTGATDTAINDLGVKLVIVAVPTKNLKWQWQDAFDRAGFRALDDLTNSQISDHFAFGVDPVENWDVICITYSSLARDADLYVALAKKHRTLLIADEVHHADEDALYGSSLSMLASAAKYRLALSGTPFNTKGGVLSMCKHEVYKTEDGERRMRTVPTFSYTYGEAVDEVNDEGHRVCRPVEFVKVLGSANVSYARLTSGSTYQKIIDLSRKNDSLDPLLESGGGFMKKMIEESIVALEGMKKAHKDAGMLVVAKNTKHGKELTKRIKEISVAMGHSYSIAEVYNDTPGAHAKIEAMSDYKVDNTDIVVSVKMISEGVDIKRLRVGMYATNVKTEMFFAQFVGRFTRWERHIGINGQHAKVIIPAHPVLLEFARNIETLIDSVRLKDEPGEPISPPEPSEPSVRTGATTKHTGVGAIYRSQEIDDITASNLFYESDLAKDLGRSQLDYVNAAILYRNAIKLGLVNPPGEAASSSVDDSPPEAPSAKKRRKAINGNIQEAVARAVGFFKDVHTGVDDAAAYKAVNGEINKALGVPKKLSTESEEMLIRRLDVAKRLASDFEQRATETMWGTA